MVTRMSDARFEALAMWCRNPAAHEALATCAGFATEDERAIGATYYMRPADSFAYVLLARDSLQRYQGFDNRGPFRSARAAEIAIREHLAAIEQGAPHEVPMRPDTRAGVNLFATFGGAKLNPKFINLRDRRNSSPARDLLGEIGRWVVDLDGNLVRDFQTTGFDARTWELYLFAAFTALGCGFDRSSAVPDFRLTRAGVKLFVEAVTANPTGEAVVDIKGAPPPAPEDYWAYIENDMPMKFGSPLLSKLRKRYWEHDDVAGHPFILAITDFHAPASMVWSRAGLSHYLYGVGVAISECDDKIVSALAKPIAAHVVGAKVVPSNFFGQEEARHVAAVMFSNAGTMAKFSRMGVLAGFGDPEVSLVRRGGFNDPTPGALEAIPFELNVEDPAHDEGWADEIEIYHNPNAAVPLDHYLFQGVTHYFEEDGELVWRGPAPRVLYSAMMSRAPRATEPPVGPTDDPDDS